MIILTAGRLAASEPRSVLTAVATDGLRAIAKCTNGWRDWSPSVLTTGATNIAKAGLPESGGHSASGPSKGVAGAARQTAPSRADPTEGQRAEVVRMNQRTKLDYELETDGREYRLGRRGRDRQLGR